jgi:hypothetical protein
MRRFQNRLYEDRSAATCVTSSAQCQVLKIHFELLTAMNLPQRLRRDNAKPERPQLVSNAGTLAFGAS